MFEEVKKMKERMNMCWKCLMDGCMMVFTKNALTKWCHVSRDWCGSSIH